MLKLKPQYFGHLMQRDDSLEKTLMLGKIEGKRRRGRQRNAQVLAPTLHKVLGPGIDGRGGPRGPRITPMGLAFPEATRAGP